MPHVIHASSVAGSPGDRSHDLHYPSWLTAQGLRALFELMKPGVTRLVMVTAACGALAAPRAVDWSRLMLGLIGTVLVVGSANALNMYLERDVDALMSRTASRPLPSGRVSPALALRFGLLLGALSLPLLTFGVSPVSGLLAALALVVYVAVYTPLKRVTDYALHIGAVPGAMPPLIGYTAVTGELGIEGLLLFAILLVWQLPHFGAITVFRREEYARAGLKVVAVQRGVGGARRFIVWHSLLLLGVSLLPTVLGRVGWGYFIVAAVSGLAFVAYASFGARTQPTAQWARRLFFLSMPYLVVLYVALVAWL
ncbi:MAG: heme o synthase [Polyangiaceae bacterium]|nr:heme o synthase [Polyangiaceae bacterium]MCW5792594.1 heme o synthase [Polyangiaceae bacterium]